MKLSTIKKKILKKSKNCPKSSSEWLGPLPNKRIIKPSSKPPITSEEVISQPPSLQGFGTTFL